MSDTSAVRQQLLEKISAGIAAYPDPGSLLKLAEALAWVSNPNQPHGSSAVIKN